MSATPTPYAGWAIVQWPTAIGRHRTSHAIPGASRWSYAQAASLDVNTRGVPGSSTQQGGVEPANLARAGESGDVHLQTATAVMGDAIQTEDGEIGSRQGCPRGRPGLGHPLSGRRHRESVGGQEGVGVTGVAHPRDVGRVEDALLYRHGGRQQYREREGSDSIDRASAETPYLLGRRKLTLQGGRS